LKFRFIKVDSVPTKALTEKKRVAKIFGRKIEPRIKEAKAGKRILLFADAAHFVCGSFLGYLWCIIRIVIPTRSGRKRYNRFWFTKTM
jgi:hypothetical protein